MHWLIYILLAATLAVGITSAVMCAKSLRRFTSRPCAGRRWRERFPHASKDDIRSFLHFIDGAMGLGRKAFMSLQPDDRVMDIYDAIHPPKWSVGDFMDIESLFNDCRAQYHLDLKPIWHEDLTLAELFAVIYTDSKPTPHPSHWL